MRFKKEKEFLIIYFFVVLLICLLVRRKISIAYFYENIYIFSLVIFFYLCLPIKNELIEHKLYRYKNKIEFKKSLFLEYSISNLFISFGCYIINIVCSMIVSTFEVTIVETLVYPVHVFIIFEIIFLYELPFICSVNFLNKSLIIYLITYLMYFIQVLLFETLLGIWNPFSNLFYIGNYVYFISYIGWLIGAIYLNYILLDKGDV